MITRAVLQTQLNRVCDCAVRGAIKPRRRFHLDPREPVAAIWVSAPLLSKSSDLITPKLKFYTVRFVLSKHWSFRPVFILNLRPLDSAYYFRSIKIIKICSFSYSFRIFTSYFRIFEGNILFVGGCKKLWSHC